MELRHLRYCVAVADDGTMTRAAARLHVAQQALSRQLADLERELGVPLFVRHPRGMALTPAGREFDAYARRILAESARAVEHVRRLGTDRQVLRVGLLEYGRGHHLLRQTVAAFRARMPHAHVEVAPVPHVHQPAAVREARVDVGFWAGFAPEGADVAAELWFPDPLAGALLPAAHPAAGRPALTPEDLRALPQLAIDHTAHPREGEASVASLRAAGWRGAPARAYLHPAVQDAAVVAGAGWTHAPRSLDRYSAPGSVWRPFTDGGVSPYDLYAVTRAGEAEPGGDPLAAAFLAGLRAARDELAAETAVA